MKLISEIDQKTKLSMIKLYFSTGSSADPAGKEGLCALTIRALLWGTESKSQKELSFAIEKIGASISTGAGIDRSIVVLTVIEEKVDAALELLQEILLKPKFDESSISKLKDLMQGEIRAQMADPRYLSGRAMMAKVMKDSPYASPGEGTLESLKNLNVDDVTQFYNRFFGKKGLLIGMVGSERFIERQGAIQAKLSELPDEEVLSPKGPELQIKSREGLVIDKAGLSTTPILLSIPGFLEDDPDRECLEFANFIFGGDFTSRLMQVLRAQNGWTYGVSSGFGQQYGLRDPKSLFSIYTFPSAQYADLVIPKTVSLFEEFIEKGLTADEFEYAKESVSNGFALRIDSAHKRLGWKIRNALVGRRIYSLEEFRKKIMDYHREQVNELIAKRFQTEQLLITTAGQAASLSDCICKVRGFKKVEVFKDV